MTATFRSAALAASMLSLLVACEAPAPREPSVALDEAALTTTNGVIQNGVIQNGVIQNGVIQNGVIQNGVEQTGTLTNGLAPGEGTNGLGVNGLVESSFATTEFQAWFDKDRTYSDMVMSYVVRCALPATTTLTHVTEASSHAWTGNLGLAPVWGSGQPIPPAEQELVSACLTAHVNRYGDHVWISLRGVHTSGALLETTPEEEAEYTWREGCFFGSLFDGTGVWSGMDEDSFDPVTTTPRGCVAAFGAPTPCLAMAEAGRCADVCTKDPTGKVWAECRGTLVDGTVRTFRPVHVNLPPATVFRCGDGTCQFTESAETCSADCSPE